MKRRRQYRNIWLNTVTATVLMIIFVIFPLFFILCSEGSKVFQVLSVVVTFVLAVIIWKLIRAWILWIVLDQCDFESYRIYQEKILRMKRNRNNAKLYLSIFQTYLVLGCHDECQSVIDELNRLHEKLSDLQKINYQLLYIDYLSVEKGYPALKEDIEKAAEAFAGLEKLPQERKDKLQLSIAIRKAFAEEQWETAVEYLKSSQKSTVFEEVNHAFSLGKCYDAMKNEQQAAQEYEFVRKWGGNTRYVALANTLLTARSSDDIRKPEASKNGLRSIAGNLLAAVLIIVITLSVNYYSLHGSSMLEVYQKRYLAGGEGGTILYSEKVGDYEIAILDADEEIVYCLFQVSSQASGTRYKMVRSFHTEQTLRDQEAELEQLEKVFSFSESESEFYQESAIKRNVRAVITGFYKDSNFFLRETFPCIGISCYPEVEHVTVNGQQVNVEMINIPGEQQPVCLWRTEPLDLNGKIQVEYEENSEEDIPERDADDKLSEEDLVWYMDLWAEALEPLMAEEESRQLDHMEWDEKIRLYMEYDWISDERIGRTMAYVNNWLMQLADLNLDGQLEMLVSECFLNMDEDITHIYTIEDGEVIYCGKIIAGPAYQDNDFFGGLDYLPSYYIDVYQNEAGEFRYLSCEDCLYSSGYYQIYVSDFDGTGICAEPAFAIGYTYDAQDRKVFSYTTGDWLNRDNEVEDDEHCSAFEQMMEGYMEGYEKIDIDFAVSGYRVPAFAGELPEEQKEIVRKNIIAGFAQVLEYNGTALYY